MRDAFNCELAGGRLSPLAAGADAAHLRRRRRRRRRRRCAVTLLNLNFLAQTNLSNGATTSRRMTLHRG